MNVGESVFVSHPKTLWCKHLENRKNGPKEFRWRWLGFSATCHRSSFDTKHSSSSFERTQQRKYNWFWWKRLSNAQLIRKLIYARVEVAIATPSYRQKSIFLFLWLEKLFIGIIDLAYSYGLLRIWHRCDAKRMCTFVYIYSHVHLLFIYPFTLPNRQIWKETISFWLIVVGIGWEGLECDWNSFSGHLCFWMQSYKDRVRFESTAGKSIDTSNQRS